MADSTDNLARNERQWGWWRRGRFQTKLFLVVGGFVLAVSVVFSSFFGYHQYRSQSAALHTEGHLLTRLLAHNMRLAVFADNRPGLFEIAQGVLDYPDVLSVAVYDNAGQPLALLARPGSNIMPAAPVLPEPGPAVHSRTGYLEFSAPVVGRGSFAGEGLIFPEAQSAAEVRLGTVLVAMDEAAMHQRLRLLFFTAGLTLAGFLAIGLAAAFLVARGMTRPLLHLTDGVAALEGGNLTVTVPVETDDEIGRLAGSFNSMVAALRQRTAEREEAEQQVRSMNALLEEKVHLRTAALEAANRELEAFNYSASHDLRAPLGRLRGFCQAFEADCSGQLDENGRYYLSRIAATGEQMMRVVASMTTLFQVQHREITPLKLDLSQMVQAIASELQEAEPDRHVTVVAAPEVIAWGDYFLLRGALENMLGNAWKFTAQESRPLIEFGCFEQEGETVYAVRDNGVGFDMAYADKLFAPFQRLHSFDDFPGTGVGLAIVQRIISRHQGKIWLESELGKGTTCFFTLQPPPVDPSCPGKEGV